jgi:predicted NBD/HSP70 family sugar kinase
MWIINTNICRICQVARIRRQGYRNPGTAMTIELMNRHRIQGSAAGQEELGERERQFARLLWRRGPLSRHELHQLSGVHPTLTGHSVARLISAGIACDGAAQATALQGRPRIPVEIDPARRTFLGLALSPGQVRLAALAPTGAPVKAEQIKVAARGSRLVATAAAMLAGALTPATIGIGVTCTGVIDPQGHALLFSSTMPSALPTSLEPIYAAAGDIPLRLDNDMHGLALRWLMISGDPEHAGVLLVGLDDGRLGASVLIHGQPLAGSVMSGNELGHTRLAVKTEHCYCGQIGCLERIFSTPQFHLLGGPRQLTLGDALAAPEKHRKHLTPILDQLTMGLSNAVNFIRPAQLVIASPLACHAMLRDYVQAELPPRVLPGLRERVRIDFWTQSSVQSGENAAWLALADIFGGGSTAGVVS